MRGIIFSKDRPLQLDCLLKSMEDFIPFIDPVILFDYSSTEYREGYFRLMDDHDVDFHLEDNFKQDFEDMIYPGWTCLLVDDDIFYREVDEFQLLDMMEEVDVVSLRLGNDTRGHTDYKGSIDGNFFKFETLMKLREKPYQNPNKLESRLTNICTDLTMGWFNYSHLKGVPANRVSSTSGCSHMGIDPKTLNDLYLKGKRIDYKRMNLISPHPHKEINILDYVN